MPTRRPCVMKCRASRARVVVLPAPKKPPSMMKRIVLMDGPCDGRGAKVYCTSFERSVAAASSCREIRNDTRRLEAAATMKSQTSSGSMSETVHSIGYLAQVACTWEVLARKAGNVCPGRENRDLTVNDCLVSAAAIAPILNDAPTQPLGVTILRAIEATRRVVKTNTNLGIVLLLAPLASVPLGVPLRSEERRVGE